MEIYPENLRPELGAAVQKERGLRQTDGPDTSLLIITGVIILLLLSATVFIGLLNMITAGEVVLGWLGVVVAVPITLLVWKFALSIMTAERKPVSTLPPLSLAETKALTVLQNDALLHSYLDLVGDILQTNVSDRDAQQEIRAALQTLGTTVVSLPAEQPRAASDEPARLRAEAVRLFDEADAEADAEPDAVIGASLRRRVESLTRRADTAAKTFLLVRRNQALRQETAEQMEALKTSLTAFRVGGQPSVPELADLAAGIQRVAREANAITEARAEVGTLLATPGREREDKEQVGRQSVGG